MLVAIKKAQEAILSHGDISGLKSSDPLFGTLCTQIESFDKLITDEENEEQIDKDIFYLEQKAKEEYALISFYFLLRYLNQHHADKLAAHAKEYLRPGIAA